MVSNSVLEKKQSNELADVLDRVGYKNVYKYLSKAFDISDHTTYIVTRCQNKHFTHLTNLQKDALILSYFYF